MTAITAPEYACPTRTTGPLVRSRARLKAVASLVKDESGIGAQMTRRPCSSRGRMTLRQHEPSAHAPCTKIIVELGRNPFMLEVGEFAAARAEFCALANLATALSRATPRDAAATTPKNFRRSISPPRADYR